MYCSRSCRKLAGPDISDVRPFLRLAVSFEQLCLLGQSHIQIVYFSCQVHISLVPRDSSVYVMTMYSYRPTPLSSPVLEGRTSVQPQKDSPHAYTYIASHSNDLILGYTMWSTICKCGKAIWQFLDSGLFSPRATTHEPIVLLLNDQDKDERDRLTGQWRDNKLAELNFVGIVVRHIPMTLRTRGLTFSKNQPQAALLTGCLTSTGSWPRVLPNGVESPWPVRTSWFCGIIFGLASITSAADQTIRLHRLSSHRDALMNIRHLLSSRHRRDREGRLMPRRFQIYTWQLPVVFLLCSALCMVVGMFVLVWSATWHRLHTYWWDDNAKVGAIPPSHTTMLIGLYRLL